ncbi:MAG: YihY/virulence factor BrkB family protein [Gallionella sp.]|nr:YihY/virulence factor BrkB family protein [Gallionella sp.]
MDNMPARFKQNILSGWTILHLAARKFLEIEGMQRAEAFAFNAFFSLFPLIILLVAIASRLTGLNNPATAVIAYIESYMPLGSEMQSYIFNTIAGVMETRGKASVVAFFILVWVTIQCFATLIHATNRAWGTEVKNWWRLPLKSLLLLGITAGAVFLGIALPMLAQVAKEAFSEVNAFSYWAYALVSFLISLLVLFVSLGMFYKLAPRRPTRFAEVWVAALSATLLLQGAESLFVIYLKNFSTINAVYGAFGGIMALLLWIFLSGCIFIFGACLCAVQAEARLSLPETATAN